MSGRRHIGRLPRVARQAVLGRRDLVLLRALAKARVLRTGDFVPLVLPSSAIARRRLRKLHDAGYVVAVVVALHDENRWLVSAKGLSVLFGDEAPEALPLTRARDATTHHFMMVRFWACVVRACFVDKGTKLERFLFEWEIGPEDRLNTLQVHRPDSVFVLVKGAERRGYFVEVDTGTESPSYVATHKIAVFERLIATKTALAGVVPSALIIVAPTARRLRAIARATRAHSSRVLAMVFTDVTTTVSLVDGWAPLSSFDEADGSPSAGGGLDGL